MKVLLLISVLLALHCTFSEASLAEKLNDMLEVIEKEQAERELEEQKKEQEEEKLLVRKLVEKLQSKADKRGWWDTFTNYIGNTADDVINEVSDTAGNFYESFKDAAGIESDDTEDVELKDIWTSTNTDPCKSAVLLNNTHGTIDFPVGQGTRYPRSEDCRWVLNATSFNKKIALNFTFMDINERGNCDDYVQVKALNCFPSSGDDYQAVSVTEEMCGQGIKSAKFTGYNKKEFKVPTSCVYIKFRSNFFWKGEGFVLDYKVY